DRVPRLAGGGPRRGRPPRRRRRGRHALPGADDPARVGPMATLETDRLTLRMLRESDLDAYAEMCADPEVMRYVGDGQPLAGQMGRPHVMSLIHPENAASIRVAQRVGERPAGTVELFGKPALQYRITREEWAARIQ